MMTPNEPILSDLFEELAKSNSDLACNPVPVEYGELVFSAPDLLVSQYRDKLSSFDKTAFGRIWSKFRSAAHTLGEVFLCSHQETRRAIEDGILQRPNLREKLLMYIDESTYFIRSATDYKSLLNILALLAILDTTGRLRQTSLFKLSRLNQMASKAGINFAEALRTIGEISSPERNDASDRPQSTRDYFLMFDPLQ